MIRDAIYTIDWKNPYERLEANCKVETTTCEIVQVDPVERTREDEPDVEFIFLDEHYYRVVRDENGKMLYQEVWK